MGDLMTTRNDHIQAAIDQCEKDKAALDAQLALLRSALKPTNGAARKAKKVQLTEDEKKLIKPKPRAAKPTPQVDEIGFVLGLFGDAPMSFASVCEHSDFSKEITRACLDILVKDGKLTQHGNRRSLSFLKAGAEFLGD